MVSAEIISGISIILLIISMAFVSVYAARLEDPPYPNIVRPEIQFGIYGTDSSQLANVRGVAVSQEDEIYVADCANARVQVFDTDGSLIRHWGKFGREEGEFSCPTALSISPDGFVYVFDAGNYRIQEFSKQGEFVKSFGKYGDKEGEFGTATVQYTPPGMAIDDKRIYVSDTGNHRIQVFSHNGEFLFSIGQYGKGDGEFITPSGVALHPSGMLYVSDMYNHRVQKFDINGNFITKWGQYGSYLGEMAAPSGLSFSKEELYVVDTVNHRVQVFDSDGNYLFQFGRHPIAPHDGQGRLHYPMSIASSPSGDLVVVCEKFEGRCQAFNTDKVKQSYTQVNESAWWDKYPWFHYRTSLTIMPQQHLQGDLKEKIVMSEEELHRIVVMEISEKPRQTLMFGRYGSNPGEFNLPQGAHEDPWGNIWVSDTLNNRLQVFDSKGNLSKVIGEAGSGPGQFKLPGELVIDSNGTVYVSDIGNGRIQVLDKDGKFLRAWGTPGTQPGQFYYAIGIALGPKEDTVYTLELFNPRVQAFDTKGNLITIWGGYGVGVGNTINACHVATGPDGSVYVSDDAMNRITRFDDSGRVLRVWGVFGTSPGQFYHPQGIDVDSLDRVWVIDYGNHRGETFTSDGEFLFVFGEEVIGSNEPQIYGDQPTKLNVTSTTVPEFPFTPTILMAITITLAILLRTQLTSKLSSMRRSG
jgi:tripartite motif-containing protein 71